jgi:taurine dioxygenase
MTLRITRLNGTLGARVEGIDFAAGLDRPVLDQLAAALWEHQVIAVPARNMTPRQHLEIALHFGEPEHNATEYFQRIEGVPHITVVDSDRGDRADSWHADETFLPAPPMVNLLHAKQLPACGGDTAFISARAAYVALSDRMKTLLDGLRGEHDLAMTYEAGWRAGLPLREKVAAELASGRASLHPLVMRHPVNGQPWLNVSPTYTRFIEGLAAAGGQRHPRAAVPPHAEARVRLSSCVERGRAGDLGPARGAALRGAGLRGASGDPSHIGVAGRVATDSCRRGLSRGGAHRVSHRRSPFMATAASVRKSHRRSA